MTPPTNHDKKPSYRKKGVKRKDAPLSSSHYDKYRRLEARTRVGTPRIDDSNLNSSLQTPYHQHAITNTITTNLPVETPFTDTSVPSVAYTDDTINYDKGSAQQHSVNVPGVVTQSQHRTQLPHHQEEITDTNFNNTPTVTQTQCSNTDSVVPFSSPELSIGEYATTPQRGMAGTIMGYEKNRVTQQTLLQQVFYNDNNNNNNSNNPSIRNTNDNNTNDNSELVTAATINNEKSNNITKRNLQGTSNLIKHINSDRAIGFVKNTFHTFMRAVQQQFPSKKEGKPLPLINIEGNYDHEKKDRTSLECCSIIQKLKSNTTNFAVIYPKRPTSNNKNKASNNKTATKRQQSIIDLKNNRNNSKLELNIENLPVMYSFSMRVVTPDDMFHVNSGLNIVIFFSLDNLCDSYRTRLRDAYENTNQAARLPNVEYHKKIYHQMHGMVHTNLSDAHHYNGMVTKDNFVDVVLKQRDQNGFYVTCPGYKGGKDEDNLLISYHMLLHYPNEVFIMADMSHNVNYSNVFHDINDSTK